MGNSTEETKADKDEHLLELGRIANAWANLEFLMDTLIWQLSEVEQMLGACITVQMMGSSNRLRAIMALLRLRSAPKELIEKLEKFNSSNYGMQTIRNRLVHDSWIQNASLDAVFQVRVALEGRDLAFGFAETPLEDLKVKKKKIDAHVRRFIAIRTDVLNWLPTSSNTWRGLLHEIHFRPQDMQSESNET
mgnify:CR=1 FL=1